MFLKTLNLSTIGFFEILCWHRSKFGTSIHYWACGFRWIILPKWIQLKKKKKKSIQMVGSVRSVGSHMILRSYAILHDPTFDPTIFAILLRFQTFWWGGIIKSCDFTIWIAILTTMLQTHHWQLIPLNSRLTNPKGPDITD